MAGVSSTGFASPSEAAGVSSLGSEAVASVSSTLGVEAASGMSLRTSVVTDGVAITSVVSGTDLADSSMGSGVKMEVGSAIGAGTLSAASFWVRASVRALIAACIVSNSVPRSVECLLG